MFRKRPQRLRIILHWLRLLAAYHQLSPPPHGEFRTPRDPRLQPLESWRFLFVVCRIWKPLNLTVVLVAFASEARRSLHTHDGNFGKGRPQSLRPCNSASCREKSTSVTRHICCLGRRSALWERRSLFKSSIASDFGRCSAPVKPETVF